MNAPVARRACRTMVLLGIAVLGASGLAFARGGGGGHGGGFHGGGMGGSSGGFSGSRGAYGVQGSFGGWRGGYGGWHGGWRGGWRGGYGGWGWLGYGLFLSALPYGYWTYWWDGVPYYYADDNYYLWNQTAGAYQSVVPPPGLGPQASERQSMTTLFAYPKNGQSAEQQARDRQECSNWASLQTGVAAGVASRREDYLRAQGACFEARGYSVK
jgi:hypothetical protein